MRTYLRCWKGNVALCLWAVAFTYGIASSAGAWSAFERVPATAAGNFGVPVPGVEMGDRLVLANEPKTQAEVWLEFDLRTVEVRRTPLARLSLQLEKCEVHRPGEPASVERGALHLFLQDNETGEQLAGSSHLKPGGTLNTYPVDVTDAVNAVLALPKDKRIARLVVRMAGKPIPYEVYTMVEARPVLEIASAERWEDDWEKRVEPLISGNRVYREACLALADTIEKETVLPLLFPASRIDEVIVLGTGVRLKEGQDWSLCGEQLVLPPGSRAPVQLRSEFFLTTRKDKNGVVSDVRSAIKLQERGWYHERQIEVTYVPAERSSIWPPPRSRLQNLPRTERLLKEKRPLTVVLFGDSISAGYNASKIDGVWPYQPAFGELVIKKLRAVYGAPITFMNHARGGGTSAHATTQADAQVAWFKPDLVLLAYGMNDRSEKRRAHHRANLEKIIDIVRARSPETEFVVITPMVNNPLQPTGLDPIRFIRDAALKVDRPGIAFVDMTATQLAMLERKPYLDFSGNGANHPNDFLMRIYAQRILEVLCP